MNSLIVFGFLAIATQSLATDEVVPVTPQETKPIIGEAIVDTIFAIRDDLIDCKIDDSLPDCMTKVLIKDGTKLFHVLYDERIQEILDYIREHQDRLESFIEKARKKVIEEKITSVELIDYVSENFVTKVLKKLLTRIYDSIRFSKFGQTIYTMWLFLKSFQPQQVMY